MKLTLDSEDYIPRDALFSLEVFLNDISLSDLLVIQRMINFELDYRVKVMDKRGRINEKN